MKISFFQYISQKHRLILYTIVADLLDDGVPLYNSLMLLQNKEGEKVYGKTFIKKLGIIVENMKKSSSVANALTGVVPPEDLTVINAAEKSGQISQGLRMLIFMIHKNNEIMGLLKSSLITPVMLIIVVLFVIMGYSLQVFPTFLGVLPLSEWPQVTTTLYNFGTYLSEGGMVVIMVSAVTFVFLVRMSLPLLTGPIRTLFLDKIPPYNYYRLLQLGLFLRMLSSLMLNGIPMMDALNLMKQRASPWLSSHLLKFTENMKAGRSYKESLDTGFLTDEMLLTVSIYAGLDAFSDTVKKMAEKCDVKIIANIQVLSAVLKNLSLVMLASSVMWIFGAIFSLTDKLGSGF